MYEPCWIRTSDPQIKSLLLYQTELTARTRSSRDGRNYVPRTGRADLDIWGTAPRRTEFLHAALWLVKQKTLHRRTPAGRRR